MNKKRLMVLTMAVALLVGLQTLVAATALQLTVKGGSAERQGDGTWLCQAPHSFEPVWVEVTGLGGYAEALGLEYDFYAADFSVLNHCFAFLCSSDGGCTRWTNAAASDEGSGTA